MKMKKILSLVLVAAFAVSMFAGCGSKNDTPATDNKTSAEAENTGDTGDAGTLENISVNLASEPQSIDPALNSTVDGAIMIQHLFEGLMKWEDSGEVANGSEGTACLLYTSRCV